MEEYNKGYIKGYKDAQKEFEGYYSDAMGVLDRYLKLIPKKANLRLKQADAFESEKYKRFMDWVKTDCTNVFRNFKELITEQEMEYFIAKYGARSLTDVIQDLDNYDGIRKYKNLYRTLENWLKRRVNYSSCV